MAIKLKSFTNASERESLDTSGRVYSMLVNGDAISDEDLRKAVRGFDIMIYGIERLGTRFYLLSSELRRRQHQLIEFGVARGIYEY